MHKGPAHADQARAGADDGASVSLKVGQIMVVSQFMVLPTQMAPHGFPQDSQLFLQNLHFWQYFAVVRTAHKLENTANAPMLYNRNWANSHLQWAICAATFGLF
jgi:hypothetical protein